MESYLIKWSNGEKRQEEQAGLQPHKRDFLIHLATFAARDQLFKAGNYGGS